MSANLSLLTPMLVYNVYTSLRVYMNDRMDQSSVVLS